MSKSEQVCYLELCWISRVLEGSLEKIVNAPSPLASAKSGGYMTFQEDGDPSPIYGGRYVTAISAETQAQIYYPDFGHHFQDDFINKNLEVPAEAVRRASWARHLESTRTKRPVNLLLFLILPIISNAALNCFTSS